MNRKNIIFLLIILLFCLSTFTVTGSEKYDEIKVFYKDIKVFVDKKQVDLKNEPFIYNDRVYLPISFIAQALNSSVSWNSQDNTVSISSFENFEETKPLEGEIFIYGEILSIDKEKKTLSIYQHIDDNSVYEGKDLKVSQDAVIVLQRNDKKINLDFQDLKIGDIVGMIVNKENEARGIVINS